MHARYHVVIAGAGPVGLFLACELRLANLSVLVLEQAEDPHSPSEAASIRQCAASRRRPSRRSIAAGC